MLVKIKSEAGENWNNNDYNKTLRGLRGQWVSVDTQYLFNDQYNLLDYNLRIYDKDIEAVKDDKRIGAVKCGYCGKMYFNNDDLINHYLQEENSAHDCQNCKDYINTIVEVKHENETTIDENGNKIETRTTKYIYGKKCQWGDKGCNKFEHRNHKPQYFTAANTYFIKYPNGYNAWFEALPINEKWSELKYKWNEETKTATKENAIGTYNAILHYTNEYKIDGLTLKNSRQEYHLNANEIISILTKYYDVDYILNWGDEQEQKIKPLGKLNPLKYFPQSLKRERYKYFESLRDLINRNETIKIFVLGVNHENI